MDKIKILIAEDDKRMQMIYEAGLPESIFETSIVNNGQQALQTYASFNPDIIILDILMPLMNGYETLRIIREESKDMSTVIIMATAVADKDDIMACIKHGIQDYILKPFELKEIAKKILQCYRKAHPDKARAAEESWRAGAEVSSG
ncbi:MAG TPA: response regulator [Deltaproteobacteria bacterium]|nr:response regulator [Deltaproteobacteria bacterium]